MRHGRRWAAWACACVVTTAGAVQAQEILVEVTEPDSASYYGFDGGVDWNGDGRPDFLIPGEDRLSVVVVSGATGAAIRSYPLPEGTVFASRFAPDMNGDAQRDLVVGVNRGARNTSPPPLIVVLDGETGEVVWESAGNAPVESFGTELDIVGDVNADGVPEIAAAGYNVARLLSGKDGQRLQEFTSTGQCCPSDIVRAAGDLDGDDVPDWFVGSPRYSGELFGDTSYPENGGLVRVVSGRTGNVIRTHRTKKAVNAFLGSAVVSVGEIDGDGTPDYVVGANIIKGKSFRPGFVAYSGRTGKKVGVADRALLPPGAQNVFLLSLAVGDVDKDGLPDYLVRVPVEGSAYLAILSGRPGEERILFRYDQPEGLYFTSFGRAGDLSSPPDGIPDLIVGLSNLDGDVVRVLEVKPLPYIPGKVLNARAFVRPTDGDETLSARLSVSVKKGVQTFSIETDGLAAGAKPGDGAKAATGPFGVFLEDGVGAATYTQIGTLDGSGAFTVTGTGTVPPELGVASLADVVGRRVQIRDGAGETLLETVVPELLKAKKDATKAKLEPASVDYPKAKLTLKATFDPKTGALALKAKVKNAGDGPFVFEIETAADSGEYEEFARIEASKLTFSTGSGAPLGGALDVADLAGRRVRVWSGATLVLHGLL